MIEDEDQAKQWLRELPTYTPKIEQQLTDFVSFLAAENQHQNLIAKASLTHVWQRHVADSLQLLTYVPRGTSAWLDLGAGAGFPGLMIALLSPSIRVTLVESRARRSGWLHDVTSALQLTNVEIWHGDINALSTRRFSVISARAFAPLDRLIALAARFSTNDTLWLLPKGRSARDELDGLLDWQHAFHVEQSLTDADAGIIVGHLLGPEKRRG